MSDSMKVLTAFGYPTDTLSPVHQHHPHLSDKMVVDLINGLEVTNDHIKVSEDGTGKIERFFDGITGKGKQRENIINKNLAKGLNTASLWLQKHESDFIFVNSALVTLSDRLLETRKGVMKVDSSVSLLTDSLIRLEESVKEKHEQLSDYIQTIDLREDAGTQLLSEFESWEGGKLEKIPVEMKVFTVLDNLRNGAFGLFLQQKITRSKKIKLLERIREKTRSAIAKERGIEPHDVKKYWFKLKESEKTLDPMEKQSLIYLSSWADERNQPTVYSVNSILSGKKEGLPHMHNLHRWIHRGIQEQLGDLV